MINLSRLEEIKDLRTVWPHEALDFTPWLSKEENIALLGDAIGLDLHVEETESSVGKYNVDIFATEMGSGRNVVIENQLGDTNHRHLGQLITYAAGKSAVVIVWVVKCAGEEHRAAVEWLNNNTNENISFFLCEIKLFRIGNSAPAVKFEVIEKPNNLIKAMKTPSETEQEYRVYWMAFKGYASENKQFAENFTCSNEKSGKNWIRVNCGASFYFNVVLYKESNQLGVHIRIQDDKEMYNSFFRNKDSIENEAGLTFDWAEMPDNKLSRIDARESFNFDDMTQWTTQFDWAIDVMLKMKKTFKKYLDAENNDETQV